MYRMLFVIDMFKVSLTANICHVSIVMGLMFVKNPYVDIIIG